MRKVVLITGAGQHLGKAFAIGLSRAGYTVVATGRDQKDLDKVAAQLQGEYLTTICDITKPDQCHAALAKTIETFGRIDVLVNNAGIYTKTTFAQASPAEVKQIFDVVVTGTATMSSLALEKMKVVGSGQIVNILDVSIKDSVVELGKDGAGAVDKAAKYAKRAVSAATAKETSLYGVTVTEFYLKWVASSMEIDDSSPAPKGLTHPVDVVARMIKAIEDNEDEVMLAARPHQS